MKKLKQIFILIFISGLIIIPITTLAFTVKTNDTVQVELEKTIEGNFFTAGQSVTIDGIITGDLFCAGQSVTINGKILGDVFCAGQSITINGKVNGSVRVVGENININGQIDKNVMLAGGVVDIGKKSIIGWGLTMASANGVIKGEINRDLVAFGSNFTIDGHIKKNVKLNIKNRKNKNSTITITKDSKIEGDLEYSSYQEANISPQANIVGAINFNAKKIIHKNWNLIILAWIWSYIFSIFSALIVGLVLISLGGKQIKILINKMQDKIKLAIGWGTVIMFLSPIIAILLLLTIIGIPLSFVLIGIWLIIFYIAKILTGIMLGQIVLKKYLRKKRKSLMWAMVVGIVLIKIIFAIPFLGWLFCLIAVCWGMGGIYLTLKEI